MFTAVTVEFWRMHWGMMCAIAPAGSEAERTGRKYVPEAQGSRGLCSAAGPEPAQGAARRSLGAEERGPKAVGPSKCADQGRQRATACPQPGMESAFRL